MKDALTDIVLDFDWDNVETLTLVGLMAQRPTRTNHTPADMLCLASVQAAIEQGMNREEFETMVNRSFEMTERLVTLADQKHDKKEPAGFVGKNIPSQEVTT